MSLKMEDARRITLEDGYNFIGPLPGAENVLTNFNTNVRRDFPYKILSDCVYDGFLYLCVTDHLAGPGTMNLGVVKVDAELNYEVIRRYGGWNEAERGDKTVEVPFMKEDGTVATGQPDGYDSEDEYEEGCQFYLSELVFCVGDDEKPFFAVIDSNDEKRLFVGEPDYFVEICEISNDLTPIMMQYVGGMVYALFRTRYYTKVGVFGSLEGRNVLELIESGLNFIETMVVDEGQRIYVTAEDVHDIRGVVGTFTAEDPTVVWNEETRNVRHFIPSGNYIVYSGNIAGDFFDGSIFALPSGMTKAAR